MMATVLAANIHQPIPSTVPIRLRIGSSGHRGGCSGLMPAAVMTQLNATKMLMRTLRRRLCREAPINCQAARSMRIRMTPQING
ncbi:hypothetical protein D3C76_1565080 [compost metagenome]